MSNLFNVVSDFILGNKASNECKKFNCTATETSECFVCKDRFCAAHLRHSEHTCKKLSCEEKDTSECIVCKDYFCENHLEHSEHTCKQLSCEGFLNTKN